VSIEQIYDEGWTLAEAADRVPDLGNSLARECLEIWGRVGSKTAEPTPIPASINFEKLLLANTNASGPVFVDGRQVFDLRFFPILYSPRAADYLNGLPLADAFYRYVIGDGEVRAVSRRIMEVCPRNGMMSVNGHFPGNRDRFHWPLNITSTEIALGFASSRLESPSDVEDAASRVLAARIWALTDCLAWGHIVAFGTYAASGVEGPIAAGQWRRHDLSIDVKNSALCETRDDRLVALWTGIVLRRAGSDKFQRGDKPSSPQIVNLEQIAQASNPKPTIKAETECTTWLEGIVGASPKIRTRTNDSLFDEAQSKWGGELSERGFYRALAEAIKRKQAWAWEKGGRPRKTSAA
jgi:hypothetical protein